MKKPQSESYLRFFKSGYKTSRQVFPGSVPTPSSFQTFSVITDRSVLRTLTILPRIRNPRGPCPAPCSCGARRRHHSFHSCRHGSGNGACGFIIKYYTLNVITDRSVLRTLTILPRIRNPRGPCPAACSCGARPRHHSLHSCRHGSGNGACGFVITL